MSVCVCMRGWWGVVHTRGTDGEETTTEQRNLLQGQMTTHTAVQ